MVRELTFITLTSFALAGCAVSNTAYPRPDVVYSPATRPPPGPNIYTAAQRAPLHSQLFVCNRWSSNLGEISESGETLLYTPYIDTPAGPLLRNPTEQACLSSGFGWRGALENGRQHNGMDLANPNGGFIYAAGNGRVVFADYRNGYGNTLEIDHGRGVQTFYAHLSEIDSNLREGDTVTEGQPVGRMGMTGNATGIHLHYEVRVDGLLVDPLHYGRPPTFVSAPLDEPIPLPDDKAAYQQ